MQSIKKQTYTNSRRLYANFILYNIFSKTENPKCKMCSGKCQKNFSTLLRPLFFPRYIGIFIIFYLLRVLI